MLYTGKSILDIANANDFAIPAFNISDWAMFNGIMDISEELAAPVIIAIHPDEVAHITTDLIPAMHARAHRSSVPVAIHWDHGGTYEQIITAIESGQIGLEDSLAKYEQGMQLVQRCRFILDRAEKRIEQLTQSSDGTLNATPLETDE